MSLHAQDQVWTHSNAKGYDRLVLLAIANFANDWGFADPAVPTVARMASVSTRQVQYCLHRLVNLGELEISPGRGSHPTTGGRQKTNLYHILVGDLKGGAQPAPPSGGVHGDHPLGARRRLSTASTSSEPMTTRSVPKGVHGNGQGDAHPAPPDAKGGAHSVHPNLVLSTTKALEPNALPSSLLISQIGRPMPRVSNGELYAEATRRYCRPLDRDEIWAGSLESGP